MSLPVLLHPFDYFSQKLQIKFKNQNSFSSIFGLIFTIAMTSIGLSVLFTQGLDFIQKQKPITNKNEANDAIPSNYSFIGDFSTISISLYDLIDPNDVKDETSFSVEAYNFQVNRVVNSNGNVTSSLEYLPIEIERCGNQLEKYKRRFNKDSDLSDQLDHNDFANNFCFKDVNLKVGGIYISNFFSNINVSIKRCVNTTENNNFCKPQEEITRKQKNLAVTFYHLNYVVNSTNFDKPFTPFIEEYWIKLDYFSYQFIETFFSITQVITDKGWIFEDKVQEQRFAFDRFREQREGKLLNSPDILDIYFSVSTKRFIITRNYLKIQDVAAIVGGILKFCTVLGNFIVGIMNKYQIDEMMINTFFQSPKKDIHKVKLPLQININEIKIHKNSSILNNNQSHDELKPNVSKKNNNLKEFGIDIDTNLQLRVTYIDIILMHILCCFNTQKQKIKKIKEIQQRLYSIVDFSEIIFSVIHTKDEITKAQKDIS